MHRFGILSLAVLAARVLALGDNDIVVIPTATTVSFIAPPPLHSQTGCPVVTATRELCSTCVRPACLGLATATQRCDCPWPPPTVYLDFPCSLSCAGGLGCETSYSLLSLTTACDTATVTLPTTTETVTPSGSITSPSPTLTPPPGIGTTSSTRTSSSSTATFVSVNAANRRSPFKLW